MTKQEQIAAALADVADLPIDDDEAWQNAIFRRHNSNVARAYLRLLSVRPEERTTAPQPPLNPPVITESVGLAAEAVLAGKHCESLASEAIDLTVKLLREIARRTPEVLTYTDIEAFIMNELNPAKVMANKDRTSCYGLMGLLAKERARRSPQKTP